jgi:hypothetical protein
MSIAKPEKENEKMKILLMAILSDITTNWY